MWYLVRDQFIMFPFDDDVSHTKKKDVQCFSGPAYATLHFSRKNKLSAGDSDSGQNSTNPNRFGDRELMAFHQTLPP